MSNGWVKLHREMLYDPMWKGEKFTKAQAYIHLFLQANHQNSIVWLDSGESVIVKRGELFTSQQKLAEEFNWDKRKVSRYLKGLEKAGKIKLTVKKRKFTLIFLTRYEKFQSDDKQPASRKLQKQNISRKNFF